MRPILTRPLSVLAAAVIVSSAASGSTAASADTPPCQVVGRFADLVLAVGADVVGDCLEDERVVASQESVAFVNGEHIWVMPGTTIQRTAHGALTWTPSTDETRFMDGVHSYVLTADGLSS